MPMKPAKVYQADVARTLRAFEQVGIPAEVTFELDGRVKISPVQERRSDQAESLDYDARFEL